MRILAIESSCDDLAICLFEGPDKVLAHQVASQQNVHTLYGGIVPEIASREHLNSISAVLESILESVPIHQRNFEGIAITSSPGLVGSLLVGVNFAKGLALMSDIPLIGINHLEAHLMSAFLEPDKPTFPFLGFVVSGGHTHLYYVEGIGEKKLIGMTVDDAAGEAYDKVAKLLGLGYPGGPILDELAQQGNPRAFEFSVPRVKKGKHFTSFSGLKTEVMGYVKKHHLQDILAQKPITECSLALDLIASFQHTVIKILKKMLVQATEDFPCNQWVIAGGVACNSLLRKELTHLATEEGIKIFIPRPLYCTDNAAMIAFTGHEYLSKNIFSDLSLNAAANA